MRNKLRGVLTVAAIVVGVHTAEASIIYLQNFGVASSGGMTPLGNVNWFPYYGSATTVATLATTGNTGTPANAQISNGPSAPSPGANVNSTSLTTSTTNGFVPMLSTNGANQFLLYTNEYLINTSAYIPTAFQWYDGSAFSNDAQRLAIQIGGNWYASTSVVAPPVIPSGNSFSTQSTQSTTLFSTSASAWDTLNFLPGSDLTLGSQLTSPLPGGNITAFGVYAQLASNGGGERTYVDSFEVDATAIPEPTGMILFVATARVLSRRRRVLK